MKTKLGVRYDGILDIPEGRSGPMRIRHLKCKAGTELRSGNFRTIMFGQKAEKVVYPYATKWHELTEDDSVWMTDLPIEQRQADELVVGIQGSVLVGGLGLGYAAAAIAIKPRVHEVVIVEKSPHVIALVWESLQRLVYMKMGTKNTGNLKLQIVCADLFEYLKLVPEKRFRFGFYDIWVSDGEGTFHDTVMPLRRLSEGKVGVVKCWNEDVMRAQLAMGLTNRLLWMGIPLEGRQHISPDSDLIVKLEELLEPRGNIYVDWSVTFWRWIHDNSLDINAREVRDAAMTYARFFGIIPDDAMTDLLNTHLC